MGCKRPFEEMEFDELRFKHQRQLEFSDKSASFSKFVSCYSTPQDLFITGKDEGGSCKFQLTELHEKVTDVKIPSLDEIDFVTGNPLSLVTDGEEDTGFGPFKGTSCAPCSPGFYDLGFPRRPFVPVDDVYSSSLNCPPKRRVPVGPNHQATIPIWCGSRDEKKIDRTETLEPKAVNEEQLTGTCVIPMPDSKSPNKESANDVGIGRSQCCCLDAGSVRCVRQHVGERRESLRESLGEKTFVSLGFCEMGEEVSQRWSEEEELDFHEVVYSNPASMGRRFWSRLSAVFPYRSKKEIVSYYFNVFMLRKRASQNRSRSLEIDSDDDEWHGSNGHACEAQDPSDNEDDSVIESLGDEDDCRRGEDFSEGESEDDDNSDVGDAFFGIEREYAAKERLSKSKFFMPKSVDKGQYNHSDHFQDDCVFQDDSCMSFECQVNTNEKVKCPGSKPDSAPGEVEHLYLSDSFDSKVWDSRYNISCPGKSFDLLPWDVIENDIFGDGKELGITKDD